MTGESRLADWASLFNKHLAGCYGNKFQRGVFDCTTFAIDCERAMTGRTLFPEFDRTYTRRMQGFKILRELGYHSMFEMVDARMKEISPCEARRGDVVGHITGEGESMGISAGAHGFYAVTREDGIMLATPDDIVRAWRL